MKELQRKIIEVRKEKESALQQRNEMIAHLKDQLQEMKAKTNMEVIKNYLIIEDYHVFILLPRH